MKFSSRPLLAAALLIASTLDAHVGIERVVEKNFPVSSAGLLEVETHGAASA